MLLKVSVFLMSSLKYSKDLGASQGNITLELTPLFLLWSTHPEEFLTLSKKELDRMANVGIVEKVPLNEPADWVSTQERYAQIEKELLAVVFGCAKFCRVHHGS